MTRTFPTELAHLPTPQLIEVLDYEALLNAAVARLKQQFDNAGIVYDVPTLEGTPARMLMREAAYKEENMRVRINEAARSVLLAYASGTNLDHLVAPITERMVGEADDRLVTRYLKLLKGSSTGGTPERYEALAMEVDLNVADARAYTLGKSPLVYVAITSANAGGVADSFLINDVQTHLDQSHIRLINDKLQVRAAVRQIVDIEANVWIKERTPQSVVDGLASNLRQAWAEDQEIGYDLTLSYITAHLTRRGVHRVELVTPTSHVIASEHEAIAIGEITINYMGKDY
jgi:phage-related baseplate assembly protein